MISPTIQIPVNVSMKAHGKNGVCVTHFVIRGAVFLWGRGRVSTGAVRAVTAVTLAVQAESARGAG